MSDIKICERAVEYLDEYGMQELKVLQKAAGIKADRVYDIIPTGAMRRGKVTVVGRLTIDRVEWEKRMGIPENMRHFTYKKGVKK